MEKISLYIHIPFCVKKCAYCDFTSFGRSQNTDNEKCYEEYTLALVNELRLKARRDVVLKSIFIGGGTPTIFSLELLSAVIKTVFSEYNILENAEFTIEANPGTLSPSLLLGLKDLGINRLSIGLQAWQNRLLGKLGRIHSTHDFLINYQNAREAGFDNISIDLMFALPGQSLLDWKETLENVVALKPNHISAYSLIVEEGTPFYTAYEKGELVLTDELCDRQMYEMAKKMLKNAGYNQYEISNFAMEGFESVHNMAYWETLPYIGCGLGAHSYIDGIRFHNTFSLEQYIEEKGACGSFDVEKLSLQVRQSEFMFCGLRMSRGVYYSEFARRFGQSITEVYGQVVAKQIAEGLLQTENDRLFLTHRGVDLSNRVFQEFLL